jgi:hypothetical protein
LFEQWPDGLHIRRIGATPVFVLYYGGTQIRAYPNEAAAKQFLDYWGAELAAGITPNWPLTVLDAIAATKEHATTKARLATLEERLATNPPAWPGWGVAPLPSTLAGRVAAVLRQFYAADLPRKEIERQLKFGEDQFRFPERCDLGTFALGTLKKALVLARA